MEHTSIPLILSFRYSEVKDFMVYEKTGVNRTEFDMSKCQPTDLWAEEIMKKENFCKELMLAFIDDSKLCILPYNHSFKYKLGKGVLQIYDVQQGGWIPFAYGDENKLVIKQRLTSIGIISASNYSDVVSSPSKFKDKSKLSASCNIHYVFQ